MIETYKLEVGSTQGFSVRRWQFHWECNNLSARDPSQIAEDIRINLVFSTDWWTRFRILWLEEDRCHLFRIRRVDPATSPWFDATTLMTTYVGAGPIDDDLHNVRCRVVWRTLVRQPANTCTYVDTCRYGNIANNLITSAQLEVIQEWGFRHTLIRTTGFGDILRPSIIDKFGNVLPITGYWADPRPVLSRRHLWKG